MKLDEVFSFRNKKSRYSDRPTKKIPEHVLKQIAREFNKELKNIFTEKFLTKLKLKMKNKMKIESSLSYSDSSFSDITPEPFGWADKFLKRIFISKLQIDKFKSKTGLRVAIHEFLHLVDFKKFPEVEEFKDIFESFKPKSGIRDYKGTRKKRQYDFG